tara:strand:- start:235 stop:903 length:669 start_codon:yes stop_codon:yes gene_type:complete
MSNQAIVDNYFSTPVWLFDKPEWVKSVNKACDNYIKAAYTRDLKDKKVKKNNDFGWSYHSSPLYTDPKLKELHDWVGATAHNFLDEMGYDLKNHTLFCTESWVQEFSKKGGGHHNSHIHGNNHVSAFYYLKCTDNTSRPIFHDPRLAAKMMKLPEKDSEKVTMANDRVNYTPKPGSLIFIPAYLEHEYGVDSGKEEFRFIHFNYQAVSNKILIGVKNNDTSI